MLELHCCPHVPGYSLKRSGYSPGCNGLGGIGSRAVDLSLGTQSLLRTILDRCTAATEEHEWKVKNTLAFLEKENPPLHILHEPVFSVLPLKSVRH